MTIRAWYFEGSLLCDGPAPGATETCDSAPHYGAPYMLAENISKENAKVLAVGLKLEWAETPSRCNARSANFSRCELAEFHEGMHQSPKEHEARLRRIRREEEHLLTTGWSWP